MAERPRKHALRSLKSCTYSVVVVNGGALRSFIDFLGRVTIFAPQLHESAGGLPSLKLSLHSCSLPGSMNAMGIETSIALVLPVREHECDTSFVLGRPPALS
ncbi:hypothetical protein Tco_0674863 [Tanacetum coccineum]